MMDILNANFDIYQMVSMMFLGSALGVIVMLCVVKYCIYKANKNLERYTNE